MTTRRSFIDLLGRFGLAGAGVPWVSGCGTTPATAPKPSEHFDLVVIGSGFGGSMTSLWIAYTLEQRAAGKPPARPLRILMLERGTWWTTPTETVQDKQVKTRDFLLARDQPTQEWSSLSDARGMVDLVGRCRYTEQRPQGLFDFVPIGKRGLFSLRNDGVSVLRASGVGGGSLIFSKILLRPPETLFDDPRWPGAWRGTAGAAMRDRFYAAALRGVAIGVETLFTIKPAPAPTRLTGPSQILMRVPGITPASIGIAPASMARAERNRVIWQIQIPPDGRPLAGREGELIDRARIFQTAMSALTKTYGTVDLSINDLDFAPPKGLLSRAEQAVADQQKALRIDGTNVCERHGRCNIGCLPGAGQTLNKQLARAIWGVVKTASIDRALPDRGDCVLKSVTMELRALTQVNLLSERPEGGYLVHYRQRRLADPAGPYDTATISADRVIVAAGSLGTAELMLRCQQRAVESGGVLGLRGLSTVLGDGFSPNGDHIAFLPQTKERINLTYGPVTTSYGQFNAERPRADGFHQIEDQGVPRALGALTGHGVPVIQKLASGDAVERYVGALGEALKAAQEIFARKPNRTYAARYRADLSTDRPEAEDELTAHVMCVVAQGKDQANGRFRLESDRLRLDMPDGKRYHEDPIYSDIRRTLDRFGAQLRAEGSQASFLAPLSDVKIPFADRSVLTSHPLGGCRMGETVDSGVVDDSGRVFRRPEAGGGFHRGLYVADGSTLPTALGVNPALTISAVALRVAEKVVAEWDQIPSSGTPAAAPPPCETKAPPNA
jgi:choline dehydrogenase-like flavoprotein